MAREFRLEMAGIAEAQSALRTDTARILGPYVFCGFLLAIPWIIQGQPLSVNQLSAIVETTVFLLVASFGQGLTILVGGLDMSIGVVIGVGGVLISVLGPVTDLSLLWTLPATLAIVGLIGLINGIGVAKFRVPAFVMTLATGIMTYSLMLGITQGMSIGSPATLIQSLMGNNFLSMPISVYLALIFIVCAWLAQEKTVWGRTLHAVGANDRAALIAGARVDLVRVSAYVASSVCAGLAGVMLAGYSGTVTLTMGNSLLFPSIAAVVVGGSSILGGRGNYLGTVGGALLLTVLTTVLMVFGFGQGWRFIIEGAVIILALVLTVERR